MDSVVSRSGGVVIVPGIARYLLPGLLYGGICGDAWDTVKHLYLFNLLLDTSLVAGGSILGHYVYHHTIQIVGKSR